MRVAIDIQPNPPEVPKSLPPGGANGITFFYFVALLLVGYIGVATTQHLHLAAARGRTETSLSDAQAELTGLISEGSDLMRRAAVAKELAEWLAITPPTQSLLLLLTQEVEPNVSFSRLQVEMEPGQPAAKITVEINTPSDDAASRQVASIQSALEKAGFRGINVDKDEPTPEGRRFMTTVALPLKGDYSLLNRDAGS